MRHNRTALGFLVASSLLCVGMVVTAVILYQRGDVDLSVGISYSIWLVFLVVTMMTIKAPMEKEKLIRNLSLVCGLLFLATMAASGQRTVNPDDSLAVANQLLTAVSTLSIGILTLLYVRFRFHQMKVNLELGKGLYLRLRPQPDHVQTNEFWTRFPASYLTREGVKPSPHITFELTGDSKQQEIGMFIPNDPALKEMLLKELQTSWPGIEIDIIQNQAFQLHQPTTWVDLELRQNDKSPLFFESESNRFKQFQVDRLNGLLTAIQPQDRKGQVGVQLLVRLAPDHIPNSWRSRVNKVETQLSQRGSRTIGNLEGTSRQTTTYGPQNLVQLQQELTALKARIALDNTYYEVVLRVWASHIEPKKAEQLKEKAVSMTVSQLAGMNKLQTSRRAGTSWQTIGKRPFPDRGGFIMTGRELEATFHMPSSETANQYPLLLTNRAISLPPQPGIIVSDTDQVAGYITGRQNHQPKARIYGRYKQGADQLLIGHGFDNTHGHLLGTGATGAGKSVLAQNIIFQDWLGGNSVMVLDPHGALIEDVLEQVPLYMEDKVMILDPESNMPFKYNICQIGKVFGMDRTVDSLMEAMKVAMGVSWESSVGMQQILRNALILALASDPSCDMVHVFGMLDPKKRRAALKKVQKTAVGSVKLAVEFWEEKFPLWDKPAQKRSIGAAERRIGVFVQSSVIRRTLGTRGESVNLEEAINSGKLILAPMGNLAEETKRLWSAILVREVINILMKRGQSNYCTTTLVFDEMKATIGTLGEYVQMIVEELRKYRVAGVFFAQSFSQLPQDVVLALKANCRTQIVMSTGADDAKIASQVLGDVKPADIQNLPAYHAYAKIYANGAQEKPCLIKMLPPKKKERDPAFKDITLHPPYGVYHPGTPRIPFLDINATDDELTAYLSGQGSKPEHYQEVLLFLKNLTPSRVERLYWLQKNTLKWMCQVVQENPGLIPKRNRIRLLVNASIGTPWWWSDYLFEKPQAREQSDPPLTLFRKPLDIV